MGKTFNLKKFSKNDYMNYNKMLKEKNEETDLTSPDVNIEVNFETNKDKSNRKNDDSTINYENQLEKDRKKTNEIITEKSLNNNEKMYNDRRLDVWDTPINSVTNVVAEAFDQKHLEDFKEAESKDRDTEFWDKYVGVQMINEKTTIPSNTQKSQLQNIPSRFDGLEKTQPISGDLSKNKAMLKKDYEYDEMVMASLKDADAILFHIYASAKSQNRDLTKQEKLAINSVNENKKNILSSLTNSQQYPYSTQGRAINTVELDSNYAIRKEPNGSYAVYQDGEIVYGDDGDPASGYMSAREAQSDYPWAKIIN